jgi:hypothetical protein
LLQTAKVLEAEKRAKKGWGFSTQSAGEGRGKKERKKEGGDLYRKKKFGFEIPTKKKDRFKIFRVWERTESAREQKAFEEGIEEIIRLRERDHKEVQGFWGRRFCKRGGI